VEQSPEGQVFKYNLISPAVLARSEEVQYIYKFVEASETRGTTALVY
jgi:hypothetical protein